MKDEFIFWKYDGLYFVVLSVLFYWLNLIGCLNCKFLIGGLVKGIFRNWYIVLLFCLMVVLCLVNVFNFVWIVFDWKVFKVYVEVSSKEIISSCNLDINLMFILKKSNIV